MLELQTRALLTLRLLYDYPYFSYPQAMDETADFPHQCYGKRILGLSAHLLVVLLYLGGKDNI